MSNAVDFVMTEHHGWWTTDGEARRVVALPDDTRWLAVAEANSLALSRLSGASAAPVPDVFTFSGGLDAVPELATALYLLGSVARLRNASLWDAIATAIVRQVIRAGQSKKLYREFSEAFGERVDLPGGQQYALFPAPDVVMGLSDQDFSSVGMAFKRPALVAAARAYVDHHGEWYAMEPTLLVEEIQSVPRIGPWTAHAAIADFSNDWSLYPYADLAVRTWAKRAAPSFDWPNDEKEFGRLWRALAADDLSSLTLLTLAWGSRHGVIG